MKLCFNYVIEFTNLHLTDNIRAAKEALRGKNSIYAIVCLVTSVVYIDSLIHFDLCFIDHFIKNRTNTHL